MKVLTVLCFLQLAMDTLAQGNDCEIRAIPDIISYRTDNFEHTDASSCSPYASDVDAPQGVNPTQYLQCGPNTLTDSSTSPPFYIWGEAPGRLLIDFTTVRNLTSIVIHYQYNDTYALPKLRIYAVPDNFQVWDTVSNSFPSMAFDEIGTGQGEDGLRQVPDPSAERLQFLTSKMLIDKLEDTKTFQFAFSEISFEEYCPQGTESTTPPMTTPPMTTNDNDSTTQDSGTTTRGSGTTEQQFGGAVKGYGNYLVILTMLLFFVCTVLL